MLISETQVPRIAWTGGSSPKPLSEISVSEIQLVRILFFEQCLTFERYWKDFPDKSVRKIFWGRARGDAHATLRNPKDCGETDYLAYLASLGLKPTL